MFTLTFLGVGSAFAKENYQSNALIEAWSGNRGNLQAPDDMILIDFGMTGPLSLHDLMQRPCFHFLNVGGNINFAAIRRIIITHTHADHVGGLEELASALTYARPPNLSISTTRPELITTVEIMERLRTHLSSGGLDVRLGKRATLDDFFHIRAVTLGASTAAFTSLERYEFSFFPTDHVRIDRPFDWPSIGVKIRDKVTGRFVVYSGDTRFDPVGLMDDCKDASIIFHEVHLDPRAESVHTTLPQLLAIPEEFRRKMILYHFPDAFDVHSRAAASAEFMGIAQPFVRYVLFD